MSPEIPCLSLAQSSSSAFVSDLKKALSEFGFVAFFDHGLPSDLRRGAFEQVRLFFSLPEEKKLSYHKVGGAGARGYTSFGIEVAKDQKLADLKEFWHVGRDEVCRFDQVDHPVTVRETEALSALPPNVWPRELPDFKPCLGELYRRLEAIGVRVLSAIALGLSQPTDYFEDKVQVGNSILRALHYPPLIGDGGGAVRAAAHEDINLITLLIGAEQPGLEVLSRRGVYIPAPSGEELIICNVGDMLSRLSNDILPSTTHRVVNPPAPFCDVSRYSLPFFLHPNSDFLIESLPSCVSEGFPNRYPEPILADDFLQMRLKEIGLLKVTIDEK